MPSVPPFCRLFLGLALSLALVAPALAQAVSADPFSMITAKGTTAIASIYPIMRICGFFGLLGVIAMGFFRKWNWMSVASLSGAFLALALAPNIINWLTSQISTTSYTQQITGTAISGATCPNDATKIQPNC